MFKKYLLKTIVTIYILILNCFGNSLLAQIDIDDKWVSIHDVRQSFDFSQSNKLIVDYRAHGKAIVNGMYPMVFNATRQDSLIIIRKADVIVDTLSIQKYSYDYLTLYQHATKVTFELVRSIRRVEQEEVADFFQAERLDIVYNGALTYHNIYKSNLGMIQNPESNLNVIQNPELFFIPNSKTFSTEFIGNILFLSSRVFLIKQQGGNKLFVEKIEQDTLYGRFFGENIQVKIIREKNKERLPEELIGTFIVFEDKAKFEKALNKKNKTVYVGHTQLIINEDRTCTFSDQTSTTGGSLYVENFLEQDYFVCRSNVQQDQINNRFRIFGKLPTFNSTYFKLSAPLSNIATTYGDPDDPTNRTLSFDAGKYLGNGNAVIVYEIYFLKISN